MNTTCLTKKNKYLCLTRYCKKYAVYYFNDDKSKKCIYCDAHKKKDMTKQNKFICVVKNCTHKPVWYDYGFNYLFCSKHGKNKKYITCSNFYYNEKIKTIKIKDEKIKTIKIKDETKKNEILSIECILCNKKSKYGWVENGVKTRCSDHKEHDMINFEPFDPFVEDDDLLNYLS